MDFWAWAHLSAKTVFPHWQRGVENVGFPPITCSSEKRAVTEIYYLSSKTARKLVIPRQEKNALDLKRIREAVGKRMKEPDFEAICTNVLKYATNPWAIDAVMHSSESISEPWVSKTGVLL